MTTTVTSGSGQSQSHSQSFIPDYEPQLWFLREFGNDARGLEDNQWDWANQQFNTNDRLTSHLVNKGYEPAGFNQLNQANYERQLYDQSYPGTQSDQLNDANFYASPGRVGSEMGGAEAGVAQQADQKRNRQRVALAGAGITPGSGRWTGEMANDAAQQASASSAGATQARLTTQGQGRALRQTAMENLARLPGQAASETNMGVSGLSSAENAAFGNTSLGAMTMGTPGKYLDLGISDIKYQPLGTTSESQSQANKATVTAAQGGKVPTQGGAIPESASPSHGQQVDDIPAKVNAGEFIIPRDVAEYLGKKFLTNLIIKTRKSTGMPQQPIGPTFQKDGVVASQHAAGGGQFGDPAIGGMFDDPTAALPFGQASVAANGDPEELSELGQFDPEGGQFSGSTGTSLNNFTGTDPGSVGAGAFQANDPSASSGMPTPPVFEPIEVNPAPYYNVPGEPLPTPTDNSPNGPDNPTVPLPPNPDPPDPGSTPGTPGPGTTTPPPGNIDGGAATSSGTMYSGIASQPMPMPPGIDPRTRAFAEGGPVGMAPQRPAAPLVVPPKHGIFHGAMTAKMGRRPPPRPAPRPMPMQPAPTGIPMG